jgi:UrcA family protein
MAMKRLAVLAAAAALGLSGLAYAGDAPRGEEPNAVRVSHADLDLTRADDSEALLSRLSYAAQRACAAEEVTRPNAAARRAIAQCHRDAVEAALAQLGAPMPQRLYAAREM